MKDIDFRHFDDIKNHHYILGQDLEVLVDYICKLKYDYRAIININNIMKYVCSIAKRIFYVDE